MELLLGLAVLGALGVGAVHLGRHATERAAALAQRQRVEATRRAAAERRLLQERQRRVALARRHAVLEARLRQSLRALGRAPDFRRAANWASHAESLLASVRHKIFRDFRMNILRHYASRLAAGENTDVLFLSLRELITALGIPTFEASYIKQEAERRTAVPAAAARPAVDQQLAERERQHVARLAAIRALTSIDDDTRQRLVEAEETRFRDSLMDELGHGEGGTV